MRHLGKTAVSNVLMCLVALPTWAAAEPASPPPPIEQYRPILESCHADERRVTSIRAYSQAGVDYKLTVDPHSLQTRLEQAAALQCDTVPANIDVLLSGTPYLHALAVERENEDLVQDGGLTRSLRPVKGYFLTADLCPSSKAGFNEQLFEFLEHAKEVHNHAPLPIALSVSGGWLKTHPQAFAWFREQVAAGQLQITWVNHTENHPYSKQLDLNHNFMRETGIEPLMEILGLEQTLVMQGVAPSVFFRFPGLVSSPELVETLERLHLVAVGSNAWLAKGERPTPGGVILIHANLNEPAGIAVLIKWLKSEPKGSITFLPLETVAGTGN